MGIERRLDEKGRVLLPLGIVSEFSPRHVYMRHIADEQLILCFTTKLYEVMKENLMKVREQQGLAGYIHVTKKERLLSDFSDSRIDGQNRININSLFWEKKRMGLRMPNKMRISKKDYGFEIRYD